MLKVETIQHAGKKVYCIQVSDYKKLINKLDKSNQNQLNVAESLEKLKGLLTINTLLFGLGISKDKLDKISTKLLNYNTKIGSITLINYNALDKDILGTLIHTITGKKPEFKYSQVKDFQSVFSSFSYEEQAKYIDSYQVSSNKSDMTKLVSLIEKELEN